MHSHSLTRLRSAVCSEYDCGSRGCELDPSLVSYYVKIDYEIISKVILPIPEGLLYVTRESMCTNYWLTA